VAPHDVPGRQHLEEPIAVLALHHFLLDAQRVQENGFVLTGVVWVIWSLSMSKITVLRETITEQFIAALP
jgi:hypothetical protein